MSIDERINKYLHSEEKTPLPYRAGDRVPIRITRIMEYGAFVVTKDQHMAPGLIHVSQIPDGVALEVNKMIDAEVRQVKDDHKVEFSLMYMEKKESPFKLLEGMKKELPKKEVPQGEVEQIIQDLSREFGIVSEDSKKKIEEMIEEMGVYRFTKTMLKTLPHFQRDLVYHFLEEMNQGREYL